MAVAIAKWKLKLENSKSVICQTGRIQTKYLSIMMMIFFITWLSISLPLPLTPCDSQPHSTPHSEMIHFKHPKFNHPYFLTLMVLYRHVCAYISYTGFFFCWICFTKIRLCYTSSSASCYFNFVWKSLQFFFLMAALYSLI